MDINNRLQDESHLVKEDVQEVVKANLHAMIGWPILRPNLIENACTQNSVLHVFLNICCCATNVTSRMDFIHMIQIL